MSNIGTVVEFTPATNVEVALKPSRVSKSDAIQIGEAFYNAIADNRQKAIDSLLEEYGVTLVRRGLRAYSNTVLKMGHKKVANAALAIREALKGHSTSASKSA